MQLSFVALSLILGLLSAIGPFAIDMYLPAMPAIGDALGAGPVAVQSTITSYFVAFGLAQLVYGPWADQAGRKRPIVVGVLIFLAGALVCAAAPTIGWLIAGRFVQGLGGAAVMVVPRAVIRDLHTGHRATQMMAAIMVVISVSPFLAPLAGAGLIAAFSWRAVFVVLALAAVASLALTRFALPETLPPALRQSFDARATWAGVRRLMTDRGFLALTFLGGFAMASFFVFIASAAFVYTESYGLTPTQFSLAFALNAAGFFGASQLAAGFGRRFGAARVVRTATLGFALCTVLTLGLALMGQQGLPVVMAGLFCGNAFLGLVIPTVMVLALDPHGEIAGLASSLGGTLQMLAGGLMIALAGPFFDGTVVPMLAAIAVCGGIASILSRAVAVLPEARIA